MRTSRPGSCRCTTRACRGDAAGPCSAWRSSKLAQPYARQSTSAARRACGDRPQRLPSRRPPRRRADPHRRPVHLGRAARPRCPPPSSPRRGARRGRWAASRRRRRAGEPRAGQRVAGEHGAMLVREAWGWTCGACGRPSQEVPRLHDARQAAASASAAARPTCRRAPRRARTRRRSARPRTHVHAARRGSEPAPIRAPRRAATAPSRSPRSPPRRARPGVLRRAVAADELEVRAAAAAGSARASSGSSSISAAVPPSVAHAARGSRRRRQVCRSRGTRAGGAARAAPETTSRPAPARRLASRRCAHLERDRRAHAVAEQHASGASCAARARRDRVGELVHALDRRLGDAALATRVGERPELDVARARARPSRERSSRRRPPGRSTRSARGLRARGA